MSIRRVVLLVATVSLAVTGCGSSSPASAATASLMAAAAGTPAAPSGTPAAIASPSPNTANTPDGFRVEGLEVRADPADYTGTCPVKVKFSATITVAGGSGSVTYKWISSDNDTSPAKTLTFAGPGSQDVSSSWTVDAATVPTHGGWSSIEIIDPVSTLSDGAATTRAPFTFKCADSGVATIGFGIGGSDADCSLATTARTFAPTDPIRVIADYSPSLRAGTVVTLRLSRNGVLVDGYPVRITLKVSTRCVHGTVSPGTLPAGHYRLDVVPDTGPAIGGEFDTK